MRVVFWMVLATQRFVSMIFVDSFEKKNEIEPEKDNHTSSS